MTASRTRTVEVDAELLERARRVADQRGIDVPQLVREVLEHELGEAATPSEGPRRAEDEGVQPPFTCIGAFSSSRGDLSKLASEDVFEPEPFR